MFPHVEKAQYQSGYKVWLAFNDGTTGIVDLEDDLNGPVFEPLRNIEQFQQFTVDTVAKTLVWSNGADLAPEFLKGKLQ